VDPQERDICKTRPTDPGTFDENVRGAAIETSRVLGERLTAASRAPARAAECGRTFVATRLMVETAEKEGRQASIRAKHCRRSI